VLRHAEVVVTSDKEQRGDMHDGYRDRLGHDVFSGQHGD
jgi:hypothetical protein